MSTSYVGDKGDDGREGGKRHGDGLVGGSDDEDFSNPNEFVPSDLVDSFQERSLKSEVFDDGEGSEQLLEETRTRVGPLNEEETRGRERTCQSSFLVD